MATADKVYSFRSSRDLAQALDDGCNLLGSDEADVPVRSWLMRQFELEVARSFDSMVSGPRQSDLMRMLVEAFASATRRVAQDLGAVPRYRAYAEFTAASMDDRRARAARLRRRQQRPGSGDD